MSLLPDMVSHFRHVFTAEVSRLPSATRALPITPRSHSPAARHVQAKTVIADDLHSEQPRGRAVGADSRPTPDTATKVLQSRTSNAATAEKMQSAQANKPAMKGTQQKHTSHATAMNASPRQAGRSSPHLPASQNWQIARHTACCAAEHTGEVMAAPIAINMSAAGCRQDSRCT